jgi:hypothetical protein
MIGPLVALGPRRHSSLTICLKLPKTLQRGQRGGLRRSNLRRDENVLIVKKLFLQNQVLVGQPFDIVKVVCHLRS